MSSFQSEEIVRVETGHQPKQAVIWLHGLGADGYDFVPVVRELEELGVTATRFLFPHAPKIPVSINNGYVMRAWYDIKYTELQREEDEQGIRNSQVLINQLIEQQIAQGIPAHRIVLAGFSQGGAITYQAGLRSSHQLAGLIALSTYLTCENTLDAERTAVNANTPLLVCHGLQDPVVPLARAEHAKQALLARNYPVSWHTWSMQHSVCAEEIQEIAQFLRRVFKIDAEKTAT